MATNQRFQSISTAQQNLFGPDSPVQVSRWQLSRDLETGRRLLQVRLVNQSEKRVRQLFLRIRCLDSAGQHLTDLEMIPLPVVSAAPGQLFGEDKVIEITPPGTVFVEVFAQRVRFADDTVWEERDPDHYIAFTPPVPMKPEDAAYAELSRRAVAGGVRSRYYFHSQKGVWTCTCGLANGSRSLRCAACGADRLWLEKNMDPEALFAPPAPEAAVRAEAVTPAPIVIASAGARAEEPVREERPPVDEREAGGRTPSKAAAIVLTALLLLAVAGFVAYLVLKPYSRYMEGIRLLREGSYAEAREIFEELEDYRDSPDRIRECIMNAAVSAMNEGAYEEAIDLLEQLPDGEPYIADCLYSLGVLAYNRGDLERAEDYVRQMEERFPDYDRLDQLRQFCQYTKARRMAADAAAMQDPESRIEAFRRSIEAFRAAGDTSDSKELMLDCEYRIGIDQMNLNRLDEAIATFAGLGTYKQSAQYRQDALYRRATATLPPDERGMRDLEELASVDYPGAADLLRRLDGSAFTFGLSDRSGSTNLREVTDLDRVVISYRVEVSDGTGPVQILVVCTTPDGSQTRFVLNSDRSDSGRKRLTDLTRVYSTVSGIVTLRFYDAQISETQALKELSFSYRYVAPTPDQPDEGGGEERP